MNAGNNSAGMSVSDSVRDGAGGKIARDRRDDGAGEMGAKFSVGMARKIGAEIFVCVARGEICLEETLDRFGDVFRGAAIADLAGDAGVLADCAA